MDDTARIVSKSLRLRLSVGLISTTLVAALLAGFVSFMLTYEHLLERQDEQLRRLVALVDLQSRSQLEHFVPLSDSVSFVQVVDPSRLGPSLPAGICALSEGLRTEFWNGEEWRIFVHRRSDDLRVVAAQKMSRRNSIARSSAARTATPLLLLMPFLLLLIHTLIRRSFRPLLSLAAEIDSHEIDDLREISPELVPTEVRSFVQAIDGMLGRVAQTLSSQRRFVADAAHELRTPLTVLSLQSQRLRQAEMSESAHKEFAILCEGIARAQRLVDQLLALARAQDAPQAPSMVLLEETVRTALEDMLPLAHARRIDLGIVELHSQDVAGPENELRTLVKNVLENALRYTPEGGCVDVSLCSDPEGRACLIVEDNGPGIPLQERERVFDPFYRIIGNDDVGSGLGLSIVRAVCDKIGARVKLMDSQKGHGLRVEVCFQESKA